MPKRVRKDAEALLKVAQILRHPKLRHQVDLSDSTESYQRVVEYLKTIDPAAERHSERLRRFASIGFVLLFTVLGAIAVMWFRGLL